jgi:hypothetical protein
MLVTFEVHSIFTMTSDPYFGTFDLPDERTACLDWIRLNHLICEEIFERGNNNPARENEWFANWHQPSVSVGDVIFFHIEGEGVGMIHAYICASRGWKEEEVHETRSIQDRFARVNPAYGARVTESRQHTAEMRERARRMTFPAGSRVRFLDS